MALTEIPIELSSTPSIVDNGNATAITLGSDESATFAGNILHAGDLTLDAAGDITLDADGQDIRLKDAGTEWGRFTHTGHFGIQNPVSDADIQFIGNDGGSTITALTLDMSAAGAATFNSSVTATALNLNTSGTSSFSIINGGTNAIAIKAAAGDELYIGANNTYALRLLNNGTNNVVMDNGGGFHVGNLFIHSNRISSGYTSDSEDADVWINYQGYNAGATRFRDFRVGNGKQEQVLMVDGSSRNMGIGSDASAVSRVRISGVDSGTNNYALEVCNNALNTKFIVRNDGESSFYSSSNALSFRLTEAGRKYTQMYNSTVSEYFNSSGYSTMFTTRFSMVMYGNQAYVLTFGGMSNGAGHIKAFGSHWTSSYAVARESYVYTDAYTGISEANQYNLTTTNSGSFTFTRASSPANNSPLVITKTQGSYVGGFVAIIEITSHWPLELTSVA